MKKALRICIGLLLAMILASTFYLFTYVPPLSENHGVIESKLYLGESDHQPLIVAFGGGEGGMDWARGYLKPTRDSLNQLGYAVLAVGYFNGENTPKNLDRISLDAIRDSILAIAQHPKIDDSRILLIGGSRGGELVLNLASRYLDFAGVIAMSTSNVSFPAITWFANTSSWTYQGEELPYVPAPFKTIIPAIKGDLFTAHSMMLEDTEAMQLAEIEVEKINGPVLLLSGKEDDQWPATLMSDRICERLKFHEFQHFYEHIALDGGHTAPRDHFYLVYEFLTQQFKS